MKQHAEQHGFCPTCLLDKGDCFCDKTAMTPNEAKAREIVPDEKEISMITFTDPVLYGADDLRKAITEALDEAVAGERERILKIVDDRTPAKHTTALGSHAKAVEIAQAIREGE